MVNSIIDEKIDYVIHEIITPTCNYVTRIYISDGYHEHNVHGNWIDGHPIEILHYEDVIDKYMRNHDLYDCERYFTDMTITIDAEDNVIIEEAD